MLSVFIALASSTLDCSIYPTSATVNLCWSLSGCADQYYGPECFDVILAELGVLHRTVNVYVGMLNLELSTAYIGNRILNMHNLSNGHVDEASLILGGTQAIANLTSEIPLHLAASSRNADIDRIYFYRQGNFVDRNLSHPDLRVNQITLQGVPSGTYFGSDAFKTVTIRDGGYPLLHSFSTSARRHSGAWIISPRTAFSAANELINPTDRINLTGFSERTRLTLTSKGLKVELLWSGVSTLFTDYLHTGFTVFYSNSVDLLEIGTDGTFTGHESILGGAYLNVISTVTRPRIAVRDGVYPIGKNINITSLAPGADFVISATNAGVSLAVATSARVYLGAPGVHIRQISGGDISTVRFVSNLGAIVVYIQEIAFTSAADHFLSDDNGDVTIVVGQIPYTLSGLTSDGHVSARGGFRFSHGGRGIAESGNLTKAVFDSYVASDAPFASLDVTSGTVIRVPSGQTFFVNSSHTFPGPHYFVSLQGSDFPAYNASGSNLHPIICAPAVVCGAYEVVFKNDPYFTNPDSYVRLPGELAEQKCFPYSSLYSQFHGDAFASTLHCVGYQVLGARKTTVGPTLSYADFGQGRSSRSIWESHLYPGVRSVTVRGGVLPSGIALNVDSSSLAGANLTLDPPTPPTSVVYFDSTSRTPGHLSTLTVNAQLQVLSADLGNLSFGAPHVVFNVLQNYLNFTLFRYTNILSLTIPYANFEKVASEVAVVPVLTIVDFQGSATRLIFRSDGLEFLLPTGHQKIVRAFGSSLTLTSWALPGILELSKEGVINQKYDLTLLPVLGLSASPVNFVYDWRTADSANVTLRSPNLTVDILSANPLAVNLVTAGIHIGEGYGPANFHFTGTVTTETGNFALTDARADVPTVFDHLIWNAASFTHRCHATTGGAIISTCDKLVVRKLTLLNNFQFNPSANIAFETVTIGGTGFIRVDAKQFNVSHYVFRVARGGPSPTLIFPDNGTAATPPWPPAVGEIEVIVNQPETGDEILARQGASFPDFEAEKPAFGHLVCSTKFDCPAWRNAFQKSAGTVRHWPGGATSTFALQCSVVNKDVGLALHDYYLTGARIENGTFVNWSCLDYREVIAGGTPGSPHANFDDGGDGGGAVASPTPEPEPGQEGGGLSGGAIAGIVIGVLVAVLLVGGVVYFCCIRKRQAGPASRGYDPPPTA